ncbi:MAG: hypothetical protein E6Q97_29775 [Desulfurellales bacterium]|nr:MAG: hypothetical protein E6Q97_29775 [Desulfurellales bacterium]
MTELVQSSGNGARVIAERQGWAVRLGYQCDGIHAPFPAALMQLLHDAMTYVRRDFLFGAARMQPDGSKRAVQITRQMLYSCDASGRVLTAAGMLPDLARLLYAAGVPVEILDYTPAPPRPDAYVPAWEHLAEQMRWLGMDFRPRQEECLRVLAQPGCYCGIINAPPAFGKSTLLGLACILFRTARIAVLTKRKDVVATLYDRLSGMVNDVGRCGGATRVVAPRRVTVSTVGSMHKLQDDYDIVFVDEAHEIVADKSVTTLMRAFSRARRFGFSATPKGRADGTSARMTYAFGPQIFYMGWQEATQLGLIVPVQVRWLRLDFVGDPTAPYKSPVSRKRHGIWRHHRRNAAIAAVARRHDDDQVLILVETVEHALALRKQLPGYIVISDKISAKDRDEYIRGGLMDGTEPEMTPAAREQARRAFESAELRHVIATDVWSTGVSFEQLAVLIRADGRKSEIKDDQGPGRVVRRHDASGKQLGVIYDCWDQWSTGFLDASKIRDRRYRDKAWERVYIEYSELL